MAHLLQRAESAADVDGQHILFELRHVLALDTITLDILNHKGERREAALIAPTHPLRALWLATWAEVAEAWLHQAATGAPEHVIPAREALLKTLVPLSFPPVLPRSTGQLFTAVDNVTPFWTLMHRQMKKTREDLLAMCVRHLACLSQALGEQQLPELTWPAGSNATSSNTRMCKRWLSMP